MHVHLKNIVRKMGGIFCPSMNALCALGYSFTIEHIHSLHTSN